MDTHAQIVVTPDRRQLCFAEWGAADGQPVFSLHGTAGCRLLGAERIELGFEALIAELGIRLITYDRPGYGRSGRQPGRTVADTAADVSVIADELGVEQFTVVGGSSGSAHALAVAGLFPGRVLRAACTARMAPYGELGREEWSRNQDDGVRQYVEACLQGEERAAEVISEEDAEMPAAADGGTNKEYVMEGTRNGVWGWVDDELAVLAPWGFDCRQVSVPTAIWYDPDETVLPAQHAVARVRDPECEAHEDDRARSWLTGRSKGGLASALCVARRPRIAGLVSPRNAGGALGPQVGLPAKDGLTVTAAASSCCEPSLGCGRMPARRGIPTRRGCQPRPSSLQEASRKSGAQGHATDCRCGDEAVTPPMQRGWPLSRPSCLHAWRVLANGLAGRAFRAIRDGRRGR